MRRRVEYRQHRGDGLERRDESAKWSCIQDEKKMTKK